MQKYADAAASYQKAIELIRYGEEAQPGGIGRHYQNMGSSAREGR